MKKEIKVLVGIAVLTLSFCALCAIRCTVSFAAEAQKIAARVNGAPITEADVEKAIDISVFKGTYHGSVSKEKKQEYRKPAMETLIENELFFQEAKSRDITVKEEDIDKMINDVKKKFKKKEDFDKALKTEGMTLAGYRERLKRNEMINKLAKIELEEKCRYSDKELEDYYNSNKDKFFNPESFRIRHILIEIPSTATDEETNEIKRKAIDILNRAKAGEDFAELAYKYSDSPYRVKGGDLGWVHKGRLEPEIEEAAFKLKVGEVSELIETTYGYHIVKLEDKRPASQSGFSEVKDMLRKKLEEKRYKELKEAFVNSLKAKAKIETY